MLIAVDGALHDSGPLGNGKATYGDNKDALKYYTESWRQHAVAHFN